MYIPCVIFFSLRCFNICSTCYYLEYFLNSFFAINWNFIIIKNVKTVIILGCLEGLRLLDQIFWQNIWNKVTVIPYSKLSLCFILEKNTCYAKKKKKHTHTQFSQFFLCCKYNCMRLFSMMLVHLYIHT